MTNKNHEYHIPGIEFEEIFSRLLSAQIIKNYADFARLLKCSRSNITAAKDKNHIPVGWKKRFEEKGFNFDWVAHGIGDKYDPFHIYLYENVVLIKNISKITNDGRPILSDINPQIPLTNSFMETNKLMPKHTGYWIYEENSSFSYFKKGDIVIVDFSNKILELDKTFLIKTHDGQWNTCKIEKQNITRSFFRNIKENKLNYVFNQEAVICGQCVSSFIHL